MATREQVAFRLREYERRESQLNDEGMITLGTLRLALRALDTERDAALGAAVRAHLPRHVKGDAYERPESIVGEAVRWLKFGVPALGDGWIVKMLEAIAAHLRDEQKGGG